MATTELSPAQAQAIGSTIRAQIGPEALRALRADHFTYGRMHWQRGAQTLPGLACNARVRPYRADGKRLTQPRVMQVLVLREHEGACTVHVSYRRRRYDQTSEVHLHAAGIDSTQLRAVILDLDSDKDRENHRGRRPQSL